MDLVLWRWSTVVQLTSLLMVAGVDALRERLDREPEPRVGFSCGVADLAAGGSPDAALQAADRAMYEIKKRT